MRRSLVLTVAAAAVFASAGLIAGCGAGETTTVVEEGTAAPEMQAASSESATAARIEKIERETEEAELEAAEAKQDAAEQAARARKAAAMQARRAVAKTAAAEAQAAEEVSSEPPDVVGMRLPQAKAELAAAGFETRAENTDTLFGIVVPSHYTICEATLVGANTVRVLAQKYGC
jgi:hypothetical protein